MRIHQVQGILFDVDLTLTDRNRMVPDKVKLALQKVATNHPKIKLGTCTSRAWANLSRSIIPLFPTTSIHITCNGSVLISGNGQIVSQTNFSPTLTQELLEFAQNQEDLLLITHFQDFGYATTKFIDRYQSIQHPLRPKMLPISDFPLETPISQAVVIDPNPEFQNWYELHQAELELSVSSAKSENYLSWDICPKNVNKGTGVKKWADYWQIDLKNVIGIGDGPNDLSFLDQVGWPIAMANANIEVKQLARQLIGEANDGGVGVYLEALMKGK